MVNDGNQQNPSIPWETLAGVGASLGVVSILVVVIGRLWTQFYFDHLGLPSSGMEFSLYDFAFRSLEALISLALGAVGFSIAWLSRDQLRKWGFQSAALELLAVGILLTWVLVILPRLPASMIAETGFLGLSGGLLLAAMLWLCVDVWSGPGGGVQKWPRWAKGQLMYLFRRFKLRRKVKPQVAMTAIWRVLATIMILAVVFVYLPIVSERLANMEAGADVRDRRFAAAILESEGPLPDAIAGATDPTKSVPVRVILTQSQNTYVLHSTECTAIGALRIPVSLEGFLPRKHPMSARSLLSRPPG